MDNAGNDDEVTFKVLTLNCWGLKFVSKLRKERFKAISEYIYNSGSEYDVVFLQEVWCQSDFETLKAKLCTSQGQYGDGTDFNVPYPYAHYFSNGIIGSGTCILSKFRLLQANYHEFSMNGYPTRFWHGDWFASKGIGVCQIRIDSKNQKKQPNIFDIHLYLSHYHANYEDINDDRYLGHRVVHAFESAQWVKLTSSSADLTIYAGDFNTEPDSLPYRILCGLTSLQDAWKEFTKHLPDGDVRKNRSSGCTSETLANSFTQIPTSSNCNRSNPSSYDEIKTEGKRIDYIMYSAGPNMTVNLLSCSLPLPDKVPGENYSFSDHEAVDAVFRLKRDMKQVTSIQHKDEVHKTNDCNELSTDSKKELKKENDYANVVKEAIEVMERTLASVSKGNTKYACYSILSLFLFIATFIPAGVESLSFVERIAANLGLFIPRLLLVGAIAIFGLMGTLFQKREKNAIKETKSQLMLILEQDI